MKRIFSLSLLLLGAFAAFGCATQATATDGASYGGSVSAAGATHYRLLSDPRTVREIDWSRPPSDLHVKGVLTAKGFQPIGEVAGRGRLCTEGQDWVSLRDGSFHEAGSGEQPASPYIRGCKSRTGGFMPASRNLS